MSGAPAAPAGYRANTGDLGLFVERGQQLADQLNQLLERLTASRERCLAAVGGAGPEPLGTARLLELIERSDRADTFAAGVREDLLGGGSVGGPWPPALHRAIVEGRLAPPGDGLRDRLLVAIEAGLSPQEAGIDPAYYPAAVLRHHRLSERIAAAESARDRADGLPLVWWDGDHEAVDDLDRHLADLRAERDALADHGIEADGTIGRLDAVALIAESTGGSAWEGSVYGAAFADHHDRRVADRGPLGLEPGRLRRPEGLGTELDHMAERVAASPEVALAFYNRIGVGRAADLVTFVLAGDRDGLAIDGFAEGLASASRAMTVDGAPRLAFGGGELMRQPRTRTGLGVVGYSPALLFVSARYDARFLADATVAALELADTEDPRGSQSHHGDTLSGPVGLRLTFDGGEDPRNILLARAAEDPAATGAVLDGLARSHDLLEPLLRPVVPFEPTVRSGPSRGWLEALGELPNIEGPDHGDLSPRSYPDLAAPSPITTFLGAVAEDADGARRVLVSTARLAEDGPVAQDPGTAAGLDLVLAKYLTLVFEPAQLTAVGVEGTGLLPSSGVGPPEWRAAYQEALRFGRGQALAARADRLLEEAIDGAVDGDGRFDAEPVRPFAQVAARLEAESTEALFAYAGELDAEARETNRQVGVSVGLVIGATGWLPGVGVGPWIAGGLWSYVFGGYPTDRELEAVREDWVDTFYREDPSRWERQVAQASLVNRADADGLGRVEVEVPGRTAGPGRGQGRAEVRYRLVSEGDDTVAEWLDPASGRWSPLPGPGDAGFEAMFPSYDPSLHAQVVAAAAAVDRDLFATRVMIGQRLGRLPEEEVGPDRPARDPAEPSGSTGPAWTDVWLGGS